MATSRSTTDRPRFESRAKGGVAAAIAEALGLHRPAPGRPGCECGSRHGLAVPPAVLGLALEYL